MLATVTWTDTVTYEVTVDLPEDLAADWENQRDAVEDAIVDYEEEPKLLGVSERHITEVRPTEGP